MIREVTLPSGAILKIQAAPFPDSRALYEVFLEELQGLTLNPQDEVDSNLYKNIFCVGFSSKKIKACLWKCMERCLYNDLRITLDLFEPELAREDYDYVLFEVAKENIRPFTKNLYAKFSRIIEMIQIVPA